MWHLLLIQQSRSAKNSQAQQNGSPYLIPGVHAKILVLRKLHCGCKALSRAHPCQQSSGGMVLWGVPLTWVGLTYMETKTQSARSLHICLDTSPQLLISIALQAGAFMYLAAFMRARWPSCRKPCSSNTIKLASFACEGYVF